MNSVTICPRLDLSVLFRSSFRSMTKALRDAATTGALPTASACGNSCIEPPSHPICSPRQFSFQCCKKALKEVAPRARLLTDRATDTAGDERHYQAIGSWIKRHDR